jgi:hypothetical protein
MNEQKSLGAVVATEKRVPAVSSESLLQVKSPSEPGISPYFRTVADLLMECLEKEGVRYVF